MTIDQDGLKFPRDMTIYRQEYMDQVISTAYTENALPPALMYIEINMLKAKRKQPPLAAVTLHSGPSKTSPVLGTVHFHSVSQNASLTILNKALDSASPFNETKIELKQTGTLTTTNYAFDIPPSLLSLSSSLPLSAPPTSADNPPAPEISSLAEERNTQKYKWIHSGDPDVKALCKENLPGEDISQNDRGLKLVREGIGEGNGEVVAVYAGARQSRKLNPRRVAGRVRFLDGSGGKDEMGEGLKCACVLSLLSIMEQGRRQAVNNAGNSSGISSFCVVM